MICYFSGTGNSRYTAELIGAAIGDQVVSMNALMKSGSKEALQSDTPFVFVCPTYAWRIPRVVSEFIAKTRLEGNKKAYFILTCGTETGNAVYYAEKTCAQKELEFMGLTSVVMPENYIARYEVPDKVQAAAIVQKALPHILCIAESLKSGRPLPHEESALGEKLKSSVVNPIFYTAIVSAKNFYSTDACIACGKCAELCPLNNIRLADRKPVWGQNCTHCMACICGCPREAIEYGNKSKGKPRYYNIEEAKI